MSIYALDSHKTGEDKVENKMQKKLIYINNCL